MTRDHREAAIEAAARAWWESDPILALTPWEQLSEGYRQAFHTTAAPIVDAVLALGCEHGEGICGDRGPDLLPGSTARGVCVLRAGHAGWHHGHDDSDWSHGERSCDCVERLESEAARLHTAYVEALADGDTGAAIEVGGRMDVAYEAAELLKVLKSSPAGVNVTAGGVGTSAAVERRAAHDR